MKGMMACAQVKVSEGDDGMCTGEGEGEARGGWQAASEVIRQQRRADRAISKMVIYFLLACTDLKLLEGQVEVFAHNNPDGGKVALTEKARRFCYLSLKARAHLHVQK